MTQPKYAIYKYVHFKDGSWRYCRAALYVNHTTEPDVVTVGGEEEKHPEGNYLRSRLCPQWTLAGPDAPKAQRRQHALLSGNSLEYERYSGRSMAKSAVVQPRVAVANGRKKVDEEISRYLDDMVASKRPGKSVRMNRNFLNAFAKLIGNEYVDQYNRNDVFKFRKHLVDKD